MLAQYLFSVRVKSPITKIIEDIIFLSERHTRHFIFYCYLILYTRLFLNKKNNVVHVNEVFKTIFKQIDMSYI
jgi:hypothetical protein